MPVEPHIFKQILEMKPPDILELIDTVSGGAIFNISLQSSPPDQIAAASLMLTRANVMLEQYGCTIDTKINHPTWRCPVIHKTGTDDTEKIS
jgi:hypothetical protein